jgi:hypothetical protein
MYVCAASETIYIPSLLQLKFRLLSALSVTLWIFSTQTSVGPIFDRQASLSLGKLSKITAL